VRAAATRGPRTVLTTIFLLDFTRPKPAVGLALVYVLSRVPMLDLGYGAHADAWRVAITARWWWAHGAYYPSRLPGYPLHDLSATLLIRGGWRATNTATMLVSFAAVLLFAAIVKRHQLEPAGLLTLTFAFTPLLWITSTVTKDHLWTVCALLAAYLLLLDRRWLLAGLALGVAAGFRLTAVAMLLPLLLIVLRERNLGAAVRVTAAALATAIGAYAPVWARYGPGMFAFADFRPPWGAVARTLGVDAFSFLTMVGLAVTTVLSLPELRRLPLLVRRDVHLAGWLTAMLIVFAVFLRLPHEAAYLVPAVPFVLLAMARILRRPLLVVACAVIVAGGFVDVSTAAAAGWTSPAAVLHLRLEPGRVVVDRELRVQRMDIVREARAYPLPDHAVLTMGSDYPVMAELFHDELTLRFREAWDPRVIGPLTDITEAVDDRGRTYVWLLTEGQVRRYRKRGLTSWTMDYDSRHGLLVEETLRPERDRFGPR
jgi:hypothetical protein